MGLFLESANSNLIAVPTLKIYFFFTISAYVDFLYSLVGPDVFSSVLPTSVHVSFFSVMRAPSAEPSSPTHSWDVADVISFDCGDSSAEPFTAFLLMGDHTLALPCLIILPVGGNPALPHLFKFSGWPSRPFHYL
jgi:hypothetical protein